MSATAIGDPAELWDRFLGDLEVASNRGIEPVGRDSDLVDEIASQLSLDGLKPLRPQFPATRRDGS